MNQRLFGLTNIQCQKLVFQFADTCSLNHPFNKQTKMAGEDWVNSFMKAHHCFTKPPDVTSIGRTIVGKFFDLLNDVRSKCDYSPSQTNADESELLTVLAKLPKIISPKDTKRVSKVVSAERGKQLYSVSAAGVYVPTFLLFPRKLFVNHVRPFKNLPILLLVANIISHVSLTAIKFCSDENIGFGWVPTPHHS
ncbi:hypothetical protein PR048_032038 [Dryococelus australis]|uniref:HTH CENPB-type domain-containing protein n=1 Tax=Dryococelus australis TaxID=614101 RepID=A0ABQ9GAY2_9NEOP|nr:hypothetical protein PR048_032038 [Dryococelus australis]